MPEMRNITEYLLIKYYVLSMPSEIIIVESKEYLTRYYISRSYN